MLEVHPPHHTPNTWRDFFLHIATIVVGLLIAVAIEQTVEFFHHRHQIAETREALRVEREQNHRRYYETVVDISNRARQLVTNLTIFLYLREHPHAPADSLPGKVSWGSYYLGFNDIAWKTAQTSNLTVLMPQEEVRRQSDLYHRIGLSMDDLAAYRLAMRAASEYTYEDFDVSHLTPRPSKKRSVSPVRPSNGSTPLARTSVTSMAPSLTSSPPPTPTSFAASYTPLRCLLKSRSRWMPRCTASAISTTPPHRNASPARHSGNP